MPRAMQPAAPDCASGSRRAAAGVDTPDDFDERGRNRRQREHVVHDSRVDRGLSAVHSRTTAPVLRGGRGRRLRHSVAHHDPEALQAPR